MPSATSSAPPRLIAGGIPTERLVADIVVSKYADHLPLYRQAKIFTRQGINVDRSTLASWVGAAAAELEPLYDRMLTILKGVARPSRATSGPSPATTGRGAA